MAIDPVLNRRAILGLTLLPLLGGCERLGLGKPEPFAAFDISGADYARQFSLTDADGKVRTLADFKGNIVVVFFGFTQCPDVCPTTLGEIAEVKRALGADGARVQGVFITVDPERDSAEILKAYVDGFKAGFVALRGSLDETRAVAQEFKVFFAKSPGKTEGSYSVDHTAGAYIFDTQGKLRLFTRHGAGAAPMTSDIRRLLAERT